MIAKLQAQKEARLKEEAAFVAAQKLKDETKRNAKLDKKAAQDAVEVAEGELYLVVSLKSFCAACLSVLLARSFD